MNEKDSKRGKTFEKPKIGVFLLKSIRTRSETFFMYEIRRRQEHFFLYELRFCICRHVMKSIVMKIGHHVFICCKQNIYERIESLRAFVATA